MVELLVIYVLQMTPGLVPEIGGGRPVLLIPAALTIAMFEGDIGGMVAGIVAGLLIDMGGTDLLGFHGVLLAVLCFAVGALTMKTFRTNLLVSLLAAFAAIPLVLALQWLFFFVLPGYDGAVYVFVSSILPKMLYTFAVTPIFYGFNRVVALRLSEAL